ncbi:MAG: TMEM175 family protein [Candidatus Dormibacteraceae bacterium]
MAGDPSTVEPPAAKPRDAYGVGRLLALSDGIFAIAMTLLVLNITIPGGSGAGTNAAALAALRDRRGPLISYVISFLVVGLFWTGHHSALRTLRSVTSWTLYRNLILLFGVCLVPFATAFFNAYSNTVFGNQVFFAMFGLLGILSGLVAPWPARLRGALRGPAPIRRVAGTVIELTGAAPVAVLGILLAPVLGPPEAPFAWLLMAPVEMLQRYLSGPSAGRRRSPRSP